MFRLLVSSDTGLVKSVEIEQSTGQAILDTAAMKTLKRWRFKPDVLRTYAGPHNRSHSLTIRVPVTYYMRSDLTNRWSQPLAAVLKTLKDEL